MQKKNVYPNKVSNHFLQQLNIVFRFINIKFSNHYRIFCTRNITYSYHSFWHNNTHFHDSVIFFGLRLSWQGMIFNFENSIKPNFSWLLQWNMNAPNKKYYNNFKQFAQLVHSKSHIWMCTHMHMLFIYFIFLIWLMKNVQKWFLVWKEICSKCQMLI